MSNATDIQLTVGLEAEDVKSTADDLQEVIEEIFSATTGKDMSAAFMKLQTSMAKTYAEAVKVQTQLSDMESVRVPTNKYTGLQNALAYLKSEQDELIKQQKSLESSGQINTKAYDNVVAKLDIIKEKQADVRQQMEDLKNSGYAFMPKTDSAEYTDAVQKLAQLNNQMSLGIRQAEDFEEIPVPTSKWEMLGSAVSKVGQLIGTAIKGTAILTIVKPLQLATDAAKRLAKALGQVASSAIKTGMNGVARAVFGIKKSSDSTNDSIKKGIKLFIKYAFGVRSFFFLYRKIRKAITEGFGDMAQVSAPLNNQISQLATSMLYLRNAVTSAFAPIASFVIPILVTLINVLAAAANAVAQFMAALLGQTTFVKAKKVYKDYAASLNKGAGQQQKNASKTQKKVDKLQKTIAGFDDVNILESKDDDKTPSGGGGGGGGAGGGMPWQDPSNMFETSTVEAKFKELADKIKGFFKKGDWEGLGKFIADGINAGFRAIDKVLTSTKVQERLSYIINAITRTFNSLVKNIDWPLIGKTFGDGINLIVKALNQLYTGIQWYSLGSSIAKGLNSLINTIDWTALGNLFANKFNALINLAFGVVLNFDWANLGKSFGKAINGFFLKVQWNTLARTLANLVSGLFSGIQNVVDTVNWRAIAVKLTESLNSFIRGVNWKSVGSTISSSVLTALKFIETAIDKFDWVGLGTAIGNFLVGIDWPGIILKVITVAVKALVGLTTTLLAMLDAVLTGIFNALTPIIQSLGTNIATGLYNGISAGLKSIGNWIKTNVFNPIINAIKKVFGISSPAKTMQEPGKDITAGLLKGITDGLKSIGSWVKTNVFDKIKSAIFTAFGIASGVATKILTVGNAFVNGIKQGIVNVWNSFTSYVAGLPSKVRTAFHNAVGTLWTKLGNDIPNGIKSGVKDKLDELKNYVKEIPQKAKNAMPNVKKLFDDIGSNIVEGIKSGVSGAASSLYTSLKNLASNALSAAKKQLGIKSPSKVFRDVVGKMIPEGIAIGVDKSASTAINSIKSLSNQLTDVATQPISMPPIIGGQVIPYSIGKADAEDANTTLLQVLDMLQYNRDKEISAEELRDLLTDLFRRFMDIRLYIGDEQIARHARAGTLILDRRYNSRSW